MSHQTATPEATGQIQPAPRRTWCYARPPSAFEIPGCSCGNAHPVWSEFEGHLWCDKCEKDFVPEHGGVFDGPIPVRLASMLGVCFDRIDLLTGKREVFDVERLAYVDETGAPVELFARHEPLASAAGTAPAPGASA